MKFVGRIALAAYAIAFSNLASGQTQTQQDRLNQVARFVVTSPMCERLEMKLDPDLPAKVESAFKVESSSWDVDKAVVERLAVEAISRQGAIFKTDLEASSSSAKTDMQLRNLRNVLLGYGRACMTATTDPIFSKLITLPSNYDLEAAVTRTTDAMLEGGGLASWQTPRIQNRGDLMMVAGSCRSKIGALRSDALVKEFGQSSDARVRNYYSKSFDEGLADPTMIATLAGCNRAIQKIRLKAGPVTAR